MMKRRLILLFLGFTVLISAQDTLLLFHPTVYNLSLFMKLSGEGILDLEGYHVLGIFHEGEQYDYRESVEFLRESGRSDYSIRSVPGPWLQESVFRENECSSLFRELFSHSTAALFMGGPDIPPGLYQEHVHLLTRVTDPYRHYLELSFLFHLLGGSQDPDRKAWLEEKPEYLISAICLGMQSMHVATGGKLIQDIPTLIYGIWETDTILRLPPDRIHRNYQDLAGNPCETPTSYHFHRIRIVDGSFLQRDPGTGTAGNPQVLSSHHQAIEKPGSQWIVTATSMDGKIIEAIRHARFQHVYGVQFHPEKPGLFDPAIGHALSCSDSIRFNDIIAGTESFDFHLDYWRRLGQVLRSIRSR